MRLGPMDMLADGTQVRVGVKVGVVVKCDIVPAHPCGMIAVHTIKVTHIAKSKRLRSGRSIMELIPLAKSYRASFNYSSITTA